jgi:MFS family permease
MDQRDQNTITRQYRRAAAKAQRHPCRGSAQLKWRMYYGWAVLLVAAAAMVGTLPGRTQGLGLVTEPLLAELAIGRLDYAQINLWATLIGSLFAIGIGRISDRLGARTTLTAVSLLLGAVVIAMSGVQSYWALAVAVTLTRGFGQSALSVISLAMVGRWFVRRIDIATAIYTVVLSVGFMIAFPVVGTLVQNRGWRSAWLAIGVTLVAVLAPAAWLLVRRGPEAMGLAPDGDATAAAAAAVEDGATTQQALSTPAFWVFAIGAALYGLVASGIGLFNESILAERGFGAGVYYQTLVVTALTALAGNFGGGWLATRLALPKLLSISLFVLAAGLAALPHVTTIAHVLAWAVAMGVGGGLVTVLFFSVWPRAYGRRHLGSIQGAAQALTVVASAVGPLLLAWCVELTGSYAAMFEVLAAAVAAAAVSALVTPLPHWSGSAARLDSPPVTAG